MADLQKLIAKQREELGIVKEQHIDVVLGGEKVSVTLRKAQPEEWDALVALNPPRRGIESDAMVGYNPKGVSRSYPNVHVDGEPVDAETWADMYGVLDSVWKNNIETLIWGINVQEQLKQMHALGKARAGQSSPSPAN